MTLEVIATAYARLQHWWELSGGADDPDVEIYRIAAESAPARIRRHLEALLFDRLAQLRATEGGDIDDYAL